MHSGSARRVELFTRHGAATCLNLPVIVSICLCTVPTRVRQGESRWRDAGAVNRRRRRLLPSEAFESTTGGTTPSSIGIRPQRSVRLGVAASKTGQKTVVTRTVRTRISVYYPSSVFDGAHWSYLIYRKIVIQAGKHIPFTDACIGKWDVLSFCVTIVAPFIVLNSLLAWWL